MIIISKRPLLPHDINQIKQILNESICPHESLHNTFDRYSGIEDDKIFFDGTKNLYPDFAEKLFIIAI